MQEHYGAVGNEEIKSEEVVDRVIGELETGWALYEIVYTRRRVQDTRVKAIKADYRGVLNAAIHQGMDVGGKET